MKAGQILDRTLPLLFATQTEKDELATDFVQVLGILLAENFDLENGLRRAEGRPLLAEPPNPETAEDDVDYHWRLCVGVFPYGAAGYLFAEDDATNAAIYKNKYEAERAGLTRAEWQEVVDYYG